MAVLDKQCLPKSSIEMDEAKFRELILYIADKCSDDPDFGATKLNKILFYSDFMMYGKSGKPITGATYFKLPKGPAPKKLVPIRKQMETEQLLAVQIKERFGKEQHRAIPLRQADLSKFDAVEISLVDEVIKTFCGANAETASSVSHREMGWQIAASKEDIPYEAVFLSSKPPTEDEIEYGLELANCHGWNI